MHGLVLAVLKIVIREARLCGIGDVSPHDVRRTTIAQAFLSAGADDVTPKTVMRYDYGRENLEQNAINFLGL